MYGDYIAEVDGNDDDGGGDSDDGDDNDNNHDDMDSEDHDDNGSLDGEVLILIAEELALMSDGMCGVEMETPSKDRFNIKL